MSACMHAVWAVLINKGWGWLLGLGIVCTQCSLYRPMVCIHTYVHAVWVGEGHVGGGGAAMHAGLQCMWVGAMHGLGVGL